MNNNKISSFQYVTMLSFIILSSLMGMGFNILINIINKDSYISIIISTFIGLIPMFIFLLLFNMNESLKNLINKIFKNKISILINYIILIIILIMGCVEFYNISYFINSQILYDSKLIVIYIMFSLLILYSVNKDIEAIARTSQILYILSFILFCFTFYGLIKTIDISNIKPFLSTGYSNILKSSIIYILIDIIPIFTLLSISKDNIIDNNKTNKYIIIFYFIAMTITFFIVFVTITSLGENLISIYKYPEYIVLKKLTLFNFLDRIENIAAIQWIFRSYICLNIIIYYFKNYFKNNIFIYIVIFILIIFNSILFRDNNLFLLFINNIYPYINLILFILMTIITIKIYIKKTGK